MRVVINGIGGRMGSETARLLARGYTEEQAEKISHRNFERIFENA